MSLMLDELVFLMPKLFNRKKLRDFKLEKVSDPLNFSLGIKWKPQIEEASCSGEYWYSSEWSRAHELHHVAAVNAHWGAFMNKIDSFLRCQCSHKKATCYGHAAYLWREAYELHLGYFNAEYDRDEYGGGEDWETKKRNYESAVLRANNKEQECAKM